MCSAPVNTQTTPLVANDALSLAVNQNLGMVADEVLQLRVTANGSGGGSLASAIIVAQIVFTKAI